MEHQPTNFVSTTQPLQGQTNQEALQALKLQLAQQEPNAGQLASFGPPQQPCPTCGRCPTCGHSGFQTLPYQYWPYYPQYPLIGGTTCPTNDGLKPVIW